jgi:hypothetical protein
MATNGYHFITNWRVKASCELVDSIIGNAQGLAQWWPSVYLDVHEATQGDVNNIGKRVYLYTKGWLPYTLEWHFVVSENKKPYGFTIKAYGDFDGRGIWTFKQEGEYCNITFDWKLAANKPILKKLSWLLKPIFSLNHLWAMKQGEKSLLLEIRRRNGETNVPAPPQPTFPHNVTNNKILRKQLKDARLSA